MRVYISADLEGISGIVDKEYLHQKNHEYQRARKLMTNEINAAIRGAFQGGANSVLVNDAHGPMTNILIEELEPEAELITGTPKLNGMMSGLSEEFDVAFLIGYHSKEGNPGVLSHSYSGSVVGEIRLNGNEVGEAGFNSLLAGYYGVPIGLVTGDDKVIEEAKTLLGPEVNTVQVKTAFSRYSAKCITPEQAYKQLKEKAYRTVTDLEKLIPTSVTSPIELSVTFKDRGQAECAAFLPESKLDKKTVKYTHKDLKVIYKALQCMLRLVK
ncbi:M55 family metallopeptidase [Natranaerobius trueperi]|nr:M55 family metallopeptidase [Natranaerobius trueperi]